MKKTVYFDLGNVLFFFDHAKMIKQVASCAQIPLDLAKELLVDEKLQERYERGEIDTPTLFRIFQSKAPKPFNYREFNHAISDIFVPNTDLWPIIEELKKQTIRLILISNTCESHYNWIYSHYPILRCFDDKILSFEVKLLKPDPRIFQKALTLSNCFPHECFYTDDIEDYVNSARSVGLDSEVFTTAKNLITHLKNRLFIT